MDPYFLLSQKRVYAKVCQRCSDLSPWNEGFQLEDDLSNLKEKAESCELCRILLHSLKKIVTHEGERVQLFMADSSFTLHSTRGPKILSIYDAPSSSGSQ